MNEFLLETQSGRVELDTTTVFTPGDLCQFRLTLNNARLRGQETDLKNLKGREFNFYGDLIDALESEFPKVSGRPTLIERTVKEYIRALLREQIEIIEIVSVLTQELKTFDYKSDELVYRGLQAARKLDALMMWGVPSSLVRQIKKNINK